MPLLWWQHRRRRRVPVMVSMVWKSSGQVRGSAALMVLAGIERLDD
ncbi:hypothetical protein NONO_c51460 [Nocardia nova SH22a]|uniref:Uncharacterized protein n=1 Tax=Nocardia nova SH22a TaxID=1415166 RepID=W5TKR3_9NOCA|nr:hypothetical protein NONO_c51460 [Nocardia nova SH22a]